MEDTQFREKAWCLEVLKSRSPHCRKAASAKLCIPQQHSRNKEDLSRQIVGSKKMKKDNRLTMGRQLTDTSKNYLPTTTPPFIPVATYQYQLDSKFWVVPITQKIAIFASESHVDCFTFPLISTRYSWELILIGTQFRSCEILVLSLQLFYSVDISLF